MEIVEWPLISQVIRAHGVSHPHNQSLTAALISSHRLFVEGEEEEKEVEKMEEGDHSVQPIAPIVIRELANLYHTLKTATSLTPSKTAIVGVSVRAEQLITLCQFQHQWHPLRRKWMKWLKMKRRKKRRKRRVREEEKEEAREMSKR